VAFPSLAHDEALLAHTVDVAADAVGDPAVLDRAVG
jgi:hypothetical protein